LKNLDEDHLAKVLFGRPPRAVRANELGHERIKPADQFASRRFIVLESRRDELAGIQIFRHVVQIASTLTDMTAPRAWWLQMAAWHIRAGKIL
jgi:hypothetical protein